MDDLGDVGGEDDLEAEIADVPAHDVLGVAVEGGAGGEDLWADFWAAGSFCESGFGAGDDDGGGSVTEEAAGDEVGDGLVVVLPGEGAELDGEEQGVLVGKGADVVGGAGDACCSGDAAEAEDGRALDVGGEGHAVDEASVDGGAGDAGDRGEEDGGDVRCGEADAIERDGDGLLAEVEGGGDPGVIGGAEAGEGLVDVEREDEVAEVDTAVDEEAVDETRLLHPVLPAGGERFRDCCLGVAVGWIGRADGCDAHAYESPLWSGGFVVLMPVGIRECSAIDFIQRTRCSGFGVGFWLAAMHLYARRLMEAGDLALVEGVLGELLGEADEDGFALLGVAVTEFAYGEHEAGEGGEIVALFCSELEESDTFLLVGAGAGEAEDPADRRGFKAEHVVFNADGEVGVVEGGVDGEGLFGVLAG